jgi:protein TonB
LAVSVLVHAGIVVGVVLLGLLAPRAMPEAPDVPTQVELMLGDDTAQGVAPKGATPPVPTTTEERKTPVPPTPVPQHQDEKDDTPPPPAPPSPTTTPAPPVPQPPSEAAPPAPPPPPPAPQSESVTPAKPPPPPPAPEVNLGSGLGASVRLDERSDIVRAATADNGNLAPQYPPGAGERGEEGTVRVRMFVDDLGLVTRVEIVRSSGHESLDRAAQSQLRAWHFKPALKDGHPVADIVELNINFRLE